MAFTTAIGCITVLALLAISSVESYPFPVYPTVWYGTSKGYHFNDNTRHGLSSPSVVGVDKIYIHYNTTGVLAVQFTYRLSNGNCQMGSYHGGGTEYGGSDSFISLSKDEFVARISGRYETAIHYLQFVIQNSITGKTRSYGYGYNRGGQYFTIAGPIYAIHGHAGSRVYSLGVYLPTPTTELYGYVGGSGFWDSVTSHFPAITGLQQVCIRHGFHIDSVQFMYSTTTGTKNSERYGSGGGRLNCFSLASNERITSVGMHRSHNRIRGLKFTISSSNSFKTYSHGPFGTQSGESRTLHSGSGVLGFFGHHTSAYLTGLGLIGH